MWSSGVVRKKRKKMLVQQEVWFLHTYKRQKGQIKLLKCRFYLPHKYFSSCSFYFCVFWCCDKVPYGTVFARINFLTLRWGYECYKVSHQGLHHTHHAFLFLFYCFVDAIKEKESRFGIFMAPTKEQWDFVAREKSLGRRRENEVPHEFSKNLGRRPHTLIFSCAKNVLLAWGFRHQRVLTLSLQLFTSPQVKIEQGGGWISRSSQKKIK